MYGTTLAPFGTNAIIPIERIIADIIENNTAIPVVKVVYEDNSIDRNSLNSLIRTNFRIFQVIHQ